ncbi:hypothetical protein Bbelb_072590 [Branchiostoma belcheri]|nr:hypothetical protein Bbelb_072590 [Branchiostoma belcheri]
MSSDLSSQNYRSDSVVVGTSKEDGRRQRQIGTRQNGRSSKSFRQTMEEPRPWCLDSHYRTNGCKRGLPWWTVDQTRLTNSHNTQFLTWATWDKAEGLSSARIWKRVQRRGACLDLFGYDPESNPGLPVP